METKDHLTIKRIGKVKWYLETKTLQQ